MLDYTIFKKYPIISEYGTASRVTATWLWLQEADTVSNMNGKNYFYEQQILMGGPPASDMYQEVAAKLFSSPYLLN